MKCAILLVLLMMSAFPSSAQDLDENDVKITLDQAMSIALKKAKADFPDLDRYILNSVTPRALLGDKNGGLFWQFLWKDKSFPHEKFLIIRVYMKNGLCISDRSGAEKQTSGHHRRDINRC